MWSWSVLICVRFVYVWDRVIYVFTNSVAINSHKSSNHWRCRVCVRKTHQAGLISHTGTESLCLCVNVLDLSVIWRSHTISIHLYLPVPTLPCLPAPHLVVILGNQGIWSPTLSPNHHSVCVCESVWEQTRHCFQAASEMFLPFHCQDTACVPPPLQLHLLYFQLFSSVPSPRFSQLDQRWGKGRSTASLKLFQVEELRERKRNQVWKKVFINSEKDEKHIQNPDAVYQTWREGEREIIETGKATDEESKVKSDCEMREVSEGAERELM